MATVTMTKGTGGQHLSAQSNPGVKLIENYINLADVATAKGSAIAQSDVIQALEIPAGSQVLFAGLQVISAMTGTSTNATVDFGVTDGDVDAWVDGFDLDGAAAAAWASAATASITPAQTFFATADTLDILVVTQTGTITGGVVRAFATVVDLNPTPRPALAVVGS